MASTALELLNSAYKQANLDQDVTSFTMDEFPYSIAKDLINTVIQEMNRKGRYWFAESSAALAYSAGVYQYTYSTIGAGCDPKGILRIRKEAEDYMQELIQVNWRAFQHRFRRSAIQTGEPRYFAKYGNQIELDCIPDQDYELRCYYLRDMPLITATTDTLLCQETDEDVFREGVYCYLLNRLGRADWNAAYQFYLSKVEELLADMKQDVGIARQFPAAF